MSSYRFKPGLRTIFAWTICLLMAGVLGLAACGDESPGSRANLPATLAASITTFDSHLTSTPATGVQASPSIPVDSPTPPASKKQAATPTVPVATPTSGAAAKLFTTPKDGKSPLDWAELLVQNIQPGNTTYAHTSIIVTWAGQGGATAYTSHTDCSGFIMALLSQSYGLTSTTYQSWLKTTRPLAETFYRAIDSQHGFKNITQVSEMQPGDFIAIRYPPGNTDVGDDTGHIMLVTGLPQPYGPGSPDIKNTRQWEVPIIDSSQSGHGKTDTRRKADGTFGQGVGAGIFRIYTDSGGRPVGYAWSIFDNSVYYDQASRPLDIGRLDPNFKLA